MLYVIRIFLKEIIFYFRYAHFILMFLLIFSKKDSFLERAKILFSMI